MKRCPSAFLLLGVFCVLVAVQMTCGLPTGISENAERESGSGEPAIVQFIGTHEEVTNHTLDAEWDHHDHPHHGVKGFFQKLGCDLVRGTEIVTKSVSEGKVWNSVKKGFEKVKNFFKKSDNKDGGNVESKEGTEIVQETTTTTTTTTTTEAVPTLINEVEAANADPEIDVRILS